MTMLRWSAGRNHSGEFTARSQCRRCRAADAEPIETAVDEIGECHGVGQVGAAILGHARSDTAIEAV
ncbi:hypothetical protein BI311_24965 [Xanthomonas citri pv. citri]|nr:hypothetical protein BI311_24965 [Xanthomonas citri pv. citri]